MTLAVPLPAPTASPDERIARPRRFLMAAPRHFDVTYRINPWMHPAAGVDRRLALTQWIALRDTYRALGHVVEELTPERGLPDLVFTANAGLAIGDTVLLSRFRHAERRGEEAVFRDWFRANGYAVVQSLLPNEGEGDCLVVGDRILAASGFRTNRSAHAQIARRFDRPVVSLVLADPRFYHLDTALAVLDDATIAYYPDAFTARSRHDLEQLFPNAILASEDDAMAFGLNACSDGRNVILASGATRFAAALRERGFVPHPVETSELQKAGGSAKCCTLELRP
jgi:N-dimethylarginine dimethylaminohydrolase